MRTISHHTILRKIIHFCSINFMLLPITKRNTPSIINATPISIAIKIGCDAKNAANITTKMPKIKTMIE